MKALLQKKNIFSRVSTIIVFTSLIVLSILQYKWVVNSGEKTISDMVRSYSFSIFGSIAQEFSHFNLLQQPLRRNGETDTYQIRKILENIYLDFEENYDMKYISSYSYVSSSESNTIYSFFDGNWIQNSSILQLPVYSEINLRNQEFRDFTVLPDESDNTKIWVIRQIKDIKDIVVYIHFNIVDFFNEKVMTTVQKALEEYEISWSFSVPEDGIILDNKNYKFSPLITIKKAILKRNVKTYLTLPYERFPFFRINPERDFKNKPELDEKYIFIEINSNDKSLIFEKEYDLAIQWLSSLILLMGIGAAYTLILNQVAKLKQLRMREKEFVATVTHELRTPLTVIHAAADNIKTGIISQDRIQQYGNLIMNQSGRLSSMIEGILLFSRLEGKAEQPPLIEEVLFQSIEEELKLFTKTIEKENGNTIIFNFQSLPDRAKTDRETIELILTNLISNSAKHAYKSGILGEIRVKAHIQFPNWLVFIVEDDGFGIEKSEIKHIFEPFYRGNKSFQDQIKGSGLGLYLSFRKAILLGGTLKVESPYERVDEKIRKGSRFTLKIPYVLANEESRL